MSAPLAAPARPLLFHPLVAEWFALRFGHPTDPQDGAWPALEALGDTAAALSLVESRLAAAPEDAALRYLEARLLHRAGRPGAAVVEARRALEADASGEVTLVMRELLREAGDPRPEELAGRHELLVKALLRRARPVRCGRCGAEAPVRAWRCRRCGAFGSFGAAGPATR